MTMQDDMERLDRELHELWLKVGTALHLDELVAWLSRKLERR